MVFCLLAALVAAPAFASGSLSVERDDTSGVSWICGWFGAWGDWASFGFENPDSTKREKFWYVPRFFSTIHRAECFFTESAPARGVPKVAMLMAQRDIPFGTDDNLSPWTFPINSRLRVYSHLRDAGCFVDVIPYALLASEEMREYGFCDVELKEARRARFVRLAFECNPAKTTWLDETWIFGRLPSETADAEKVPVVDVSGDKDRQLVIAAGTEDLYQGHPTTVLTRTGKLVCVWTTNHGGPCGPAAESLDGGRTWTRIDERFPKEYASTCWNCPTLQKMALPDGGERLLVFSARPPDGAVNHYDCPGICPLGITYSDDDGATWRMAPRAEVSSIMPPTGFIQLKDGSVALFGQVRKHMGTKSYAPASDQDIWMATSPDGLKWSAPRVVASVPEKNLCEPFALRSPDGDEIALLIRENRHTSRSMMCFSRDEGVTWSKPQDTSLALTGDRHECVSLPGGRVFAAFRDRARVFGTYGHYVAWIGTYDDLRSGREGGVRVKLLHSYAGDERFANASFVGDTGYSGVELLQDGEILCTTYIKYWPDARKHSVVSTRLRPEEAVK